MSKYKESLNELKALGVSAYELGRLTKIYNSKSDEDKEVFDKYAHLLVERHLLSFDKIREDVNSVRRNVKTITNITVFLFVIAILAFVFNLIIATTMGGL